MTKKLFAVHGSAKGKHSFDVAPVAHVWAESPADAEAKGRHIIGMNPTADDFVDSVLNCNTSDKTTHAAIQAEEKQTRELRNAQRRNEEHAAMLRHAGKGSHDPIYENSKKNK